MLVFSTYFVNGCPSNLLSGSIPPPPRPCLNKYTVYTYTVHCVWGRYGVLGFRQINTCSKVPLPVHFLDDDILHCLIWDFLDRERIRYLCKWYYKGASVVYKRCTVQAVEHCQSGSTWWFLEDHAFLRSYDSAPRPHPLLSTSCLSSYGNLSSCNKQLIDLWTRIKNLRSKLFILKHEAVDDPTKTFALVPL
jgi:hypothetical protein